MTLIPLAAAAMTAVAGAGISVPFLRSRSGSLERLSDPLEDERLILLRRLRELEQERNEGSLDDQTYQHLQKETERMAIVVLRGLQDRDERRELAAAITRRRARAARTPSQAGGRSGLLPGLLVAAAIVAATVPLLAAALANRGAGALITGDASSGTSPQPATAVSFFERQVQAHPDDIGARLDLAQQYLAVGDIQPATNQYLQVVKLDPRNVEAHTQIGLLLYEAQLPDQALQAVDHALQVEPRYPEALYLKGVILLALHRPSNAVVALQGYLAAAPLGTHRDEVEQLLRIGSGSGPSPP